LQNIGQKSIEGISNSKAAKAAAVAAEKEEEGFE